MYYGEIKDCDIANGEGVRVTLFVSGCTNRCPGCFQPQTWAFDYGQPFTAETEGVSYHGSDTPPGMLFACQPPHCGGQGRSRYPPPGGKVGRRKEGRKRNGVYHRDL